MNYVIGAFDLQSLNIEYSVYFMNLMNILIKNYGF